MFHQSFSKSKPDLAAAIAKHADKSIAPFRTDIFEAAMAQGRLSLADAKSRWTKRLRNINKDVMSRTMGGQLIGKPLCPSACEDSTIAEFLLNIRVDPFGRWNMMYYADSEFAALYYKTKMFDPRFEDHFDDMMLRLIEQLQQDWDLFQSMEPDANASTIRAYQDILSRTLEVRAAQTEAKLYGDAKNDWQRYFGEMVRCAA